MYKYVGIPATLLHGQNLHACCNKSVDIDLATALINKPTLGCIFIACNCLLTTNLLQQFVEDKPVAIGLLRINLLQQFVEDKPACCKYVSTRCNKSAVAENLILTVSLQLDEIETFTATS